jgi:hypothetical protein
MRLSQVRSTIRWTTVVSAVIAIFLGVILILRRQAHFERLLAKHEARLAAIDVLTLRRQAHYKGLADLHAAKAQRLRSTHGTRISRNGAFVHVPLVPQAVVEFHMNLAKKYERAALDPWLPVEPDPPEPGP